MSKVLQFQNRHRLKLAKGVKGHISMRKAETFRSVLTMDEYDAEIILACLKYRTETELKSSCEEEMNQWRAGQEECKRIIARIEKHLELSQETGEAGIDIIITLEERNTLINSLENMQDLAEEDDWNIGFQLDLNTIHASQWQTYTQWQAKVLKKKN
ncbi:hypothetical protein [Desulfitobacterium sp.]|uniref:hypothetical protein n=1 Tax=Desulfitobacterium sp. TaxID=49981 RepID=UPI002B8EA8BC|nr:hypothetical protein [Desulfitobacterium sp.]HVJ49224.1 hypothetical protein [Desulfitobacterium sp.]